MYAKERKAIHDGYVFSGEVGNAKKMNTCADKYRKQGYRARVIYTPGNNTPLWSVYIKPKRREVEE